MAYDDIDSELIDHSQTSLAAEVEYSEQHGLTTTTLRMTGATSLAILLRELSELAIHAPGGHQHLCNEARIWADCLSPIQKD